MNHGVNLFAFFSSGLAMRTQLTDRGLLLPRQWFEGVEEVEIVREPNRILIVPVAARDPIRELGQQPIDLDLADASVHHDRYLCSP